MIAIAIIRPVLATIPPSAVEAWEGAPSSRRKAISKPGRRLSIRPSGASRVRASQGMAATPPARISPTAR